MPSCAAAIDAATDAAMDVAELLRRRSKSADNYMPCAFLGEHLEELRMRLFRSAIAVAVAFCACWAYRVPLTDRVFEPYAAAAERLNAELDQRAGAVAHRVERHADLTQMPHALPEAMLVAPCGAAVTHYGE